MSGQGRYFDPSKGVKWNVKTEVEVMQDLVEKRETIFSLHREYQDSSLQTRSAKLIPDLVSHDNSFAQAFERYSEFCQAVGTPVFPVTSATIALYVFAKNSFHKSAYTSAIQYLNRVKNTTDTLWEAEAGSFEEENSIRIQTGLKAFQKERTSNLIADDSGNSRSSNEDSVVSNSGSDSETKSVKSASAERVEQLLVRGLPTLGERFESIEELVAVTYIALLRVYGSGTRYNSPTSLHIECARAHSSYRKTSEGTCRWRLAFEKDQSTREVIVCRDRSHLYHNHGANPKLVKDPNWKPTIQNKLVRKRLGMDELGSGRQTKRTPPSRSDSEPELNPKSQSEIVFKKPKLPSRIASPITTVASPRASTSSQRPTTAAQNGDRLLYASSRQYPQQQLHHPSSSSVYTPLQSIPQQHPTQSQPTAGSPSHSLNTPSPSTILPHFESPDSFLPQLTSFLRSLDPSLSSLATPLHSSGLDSLELLHKFSAFEATTRFVFWTPQGEGRRSNNLELSFTLTQTEVEGSAKCRLGLMNGFE